MMAGRCPLPIFVLTPPYVTPSPCTPTEHQLAGLAPGSIVAAQIRDVDRDWDTLQEWAPRLRRLAPHAPMIIVIPDANPSAALQLAWRAASLAVRAVIVDGEPVAPTLRRTMTKPVDLAGDVTEWLVHVGCRITANDMALAQEILRRGPAHRTLSDLLSSLGESERAVRKRFQSHGVVAPSTWFTLACALHALLRLQREPSRALYDLALDLGYADLSAMSRQLRRLFGRPPSELRHLLGWEWALWHWRTSLAGERVPGARDILPS